MTSTDNQQESNFFFFRPYLAVAVVEVTLSTERPLEGLHLREQLLLQRLQLPHPGGPPPGLPDRPARPGGRLLQGVEDVL